MSKKRADQSANAEDSRAGEAQKIAAGLAARDFSALSGYESIQKRLIGLHTTGKIPQVMMFVGREGLGKRRLAAFVAALFACERGSGCGTCPQCRELIAGRNPEMLWIDPEEGNLKGTPGGPLKIEQISSLQDHLSYRAAGISQHSGGTASVSARLCVIIDADRMTEQAANRLLKTLEEPPEGARIILTTSRPGALLPTIRSRVVRWNVAPPDTSGGLRILRRLVGEALPGATDAQLVEALRRSGGSPGGAQQLLLEADAHAAAGEAVQRFLEEDDTSVQLRLAEEFARIFGWSPVQLLDQCEWELNKIYRRGVSPSKRAFAVARLRERRAMLSQVRWLAGRRQIHLNTQLMAEGIALGRKDI